MVDKKTFLSAAAIVIIVVLAGFFFFLQPAAEKKPVRVLAWVGYDEKDLYANFEKETGSLVQVKAFVGGDKLYSLLMNSHEEYDMIIVDQEYVEKLATNNRLLELSPNDFDLRSQYPIFRDSTHMTVGAKRFGIVLRFGSNGILYNPKYVSAEEANSYSLLWPEKFRGKIGIWDWYHPNLGVLSLYNGNKEPYNLSSQKFSDLQNTLMSLRPQVKSFFATTAELFDAMVKEEVYIVPAAGEWTAAGIKEQGLEVDWTVPKEGGVMWVEAAAIPNDSQNVAGATKLIQYLSSAKASAKVAWRKAYIGAPANMNAFAFLSEEQKQTLKLSGNLETDSEIISRLYYRALPIQQTEQEWQKIWTSFKAR